MRDPSHAAGDRPARPVGRDDGLLDALRGVLAAAEPMPAHVAEGARMAFSLRDLPVLQAPARPSRPARRRVR
jgi:hypothetical protein